MAKAKKSPRRASKSKPKPKAKASKKAPPRKTAKAQPSTGAARAPRREVPLSIAPDPLLHTQVDREVIPVGESEPAETVPYGTVRT